MERWRRHAIEQLEASKQKLEELAGRYEQQARTGPVYTVTEWGVMPTRKGMRSLARFHRTLIESTEQWIEKLEKGSP